MISRRWKASSGRIPSRACRRSLRLGSICGTVVASGFVRRFFFFLSKLFDYQGRGAVRLGAVVEIIHTATLVHDDIIDEAKTRRGRPAANTQWGNSKCVLAGDWLYMQAFKVAVQERNFRILDTSDRTDAADGGRRTAADGKTRTS